MRKTRHIIETSQHFIIVFTNHVVNAFIIKQTTFSFNNIDKLNLRLMRASTYFSQFQLNVRYRFDKRHVLFDVLSRLLIDRFFLNDEENLNLNQIKRHRFYEKSILIFMSFESFHTLIINFIMTLFDEWDALFIVTNKYFRRVMLIYDKIIYEAIDWVTLLIDRLLQTDWEISKIIISNKNLKFLSNFWKIVFKRLRTKLLTNTTYHFQIDENFERINQTMKIVLRYLIITYSNVKHIIFWLSLFTSFDLLTTSLFLLSHFFKVQYRYL